MKPLFLRAPHNYNVDEVSQAAGLACPDDSVTQQQFAEECDINNIVRRFGLTGELPENYRAPVSGDFTGITDYHTALTAVRQAEERFMEMPGELRYKFANDPNRLIGFLDDPNNRAEAIALGLVNPPPPPAPATPEEPS